MSIENKIWDDPKKQEARRQSVVEVCQEVIGPKLPEAQQYWTLCGRMYLKNKLQKNCELNQLVESGFIRAKQFYGAEIIEKIHIGNWKVTEDTEANFRYEEGGIVPILHSFCGLNPGVVNLDTHVGPKKAIQLAAEVMDVINSTTCPKTVLIINMIMKQSYYGHNHEWESSDDSSDEQDTDVKSVIESNNLFNAVYKYGWTEYDRKFDYGGTDNGTRKSKSTMGTMVLVRHSGQ